jgi:hypothetical protein
MMTVPKSSVPTDHVQLDYPYDSYWMPLLVQEWYLLSGLVFLVILSRSSSRFSDGDIR